MDYQRVANAVPGEESREDYYEALRRSSERWHDGRHDLIPWLNHFLPIIRRAYNEFAGRADATQSKRGAKTDLIEGNNPERG